MTGSPVIRSNVEVSPDKLLLNTAEACEVLNISVSVLYKLVKEGKIPTIKWCRKILIPRAALEMQLREAGINRSKESRINQIA